MLVEVSPMLTTRAALQVCLWVTSHLCGICPTQCWWGVSFTLKRRDNKHSTVAKETPNVKNMKKANKYPVHQWVVWRGSVHSTDSWRPAPSAERVPSWSDHRAGSSPGLQTSWLTRRARPHGAWCRGHRWSSWKREGRNGANEGKTERKQRGQTCYCHSGKTKGLSVRRVSLTELRLLCRLSDKVARLDLRCVFVLGWMYESVCISGSVCLLTETGLSMEHWWARLGYEPSFDTGAEGRSLRNLENPTVLSQGWCTGVSCIGLAGNSQQTRWL